MKHVKVLMILLILAIGTIIFSGCSPAEKQLYQLQKESSQLKTYESNGEIVIKISQFPQELTDDEDFSQSILPQLLKNLTFTYSEKVDMEKELMSLAVNLKLADSLAPQEILSIIYKDHVIYIKIDNLVKLLKTFDDEEMSQNLAIFEGQKYLSISEKELLELITANDSSIQTKSLESIWDMGQLQKQQELYQKLMEGLMTPFDQYETGIVTKQGNKFIITLTPDGIIDLIKPLLVYSVDNVDKIETFIKTTVQNLDEEELSMLSLDPENRDEYMQNIDDAVAEFKQSGPEIISEFENVEDEVDQTIQNVLGDSKITATFEKTGSNQYDSNIEAFIDINDPEELNKLFSMSLEVKDRTEKSSSFDVSVPSDDIISLTELMSKLPKVMTIEPNDGYYTLTQGLGH